MKDKGKALEVIEPFIYQQLEYWKVPGCVASIFTSKEIVITRAFGFNNLEKKQEMNKDIVFSIGSCRKSMTAALAAGLVDVKKFEWNQPINEYIPKFELKSSYATKYMSMADILSHRTNVGKNTLFWDFYPWERKKLLNDIRNFDCFESYNHLINYNNLMYSVAECIIEYLTNQTFEDYINIELWNKLNMSKCGFGVSKMLEYSHIINNYNYYDGKYHIIPYWTSTLKNNIFMSIQDVIRWVQFFLNRGISEGKQIVSYNNLSQCIIPQTIIPTKKDIYTSDRIALNKTFLFYGMGWFIQIYRGKTLLYHEGKEFGSDLYISYMPDEDMGVVLIFNKEDYKIPHILSYYLYDLFVFEETINWFDYYRNNYLEKKYYHTGMQVGEIKNRNIAQYKGYYYNSVLGGLDIYIKNDKLRLKYFELDIPLQKIEGGYIGIPDKEFVCAKNRLGYDNSLELKFVINKDKTTKILIKNDDFLPCLEFVRKGKS